jgi:hypothetical protein
MSVTHTCPNCDLTFTDPQRFIKHRFDELARWFDGLGEFDNAAKYRTKNPADYQIVNGIIEARRPQ